MFVLEGLQATVPKCVGMVMVSSANFTCHPAIVHSLLPSNHTRTHTHTQWQSHKLNFSLFREASRVRQRLDIDLTKQVESAVCINCRQA